mmetsp:Transcript_6860/g.7923  ORF Transcript_6860/g.7923 Transcript_6860/m.7923 type:complete len:224 (-) Transcript_6860:457-1128(-)
MGRLQVHLSLQLLGVAVSDCFLDLGDLFLTVLLAVLLHGEFFLLLSGASPDLDIVGLLGLVELEGLSIFLHHLRVEGHDALIVQVLVALLEQLDLVLADHAHTAHEELSQHISRSFLLLLLQAAELLIHQSQLVGLDLILLELDLALLFLFDFLVAPVLELGFAVASEVLLSGSHGFLDVLHATHFFIELALDLLEDADALAVGCPRLLHLSEDLSELVSEAD